MKLLMIKCSSTDWCGCEEYFGYRTDTKSQEVAQEKAIEDLSDDMETFVITEMIGELGEGEEVGSFHYTSEWYSLEEFGPIEGYDVLN